MSIHFPHAISGGNVNGTFKVSPIEDTVWQRMYQRKSVDEGLRSEFFRLLENGPNPFQKQPFRPCSLFYLAIWEGYAPIVQGLIEFAKEKGCLAEIVMDNDENDQLNPLHAACEQKSCEEGNLAIVSMLLEAGASPFILSGQGFSPFHMAVTRKDTQIAETIIQYFRETYPEPVLFDLLELPTSSASNSRTALHLACCTIQGKENDANLPVLLKAGASLFSFDAEGCSPLHTAVYKKNKKAVECILRHARDGGVLQELLDQKKQSGLGLTAREIAKQRNFEEIANFLLQAEYHLRAPEVFPLFPEERPQFPDLEEPRTFSFSGSWS